jgi:capsular polysaccharide biosynthesis protein
MGDLAMGSGHDSKKDPTDPKFVRSTITAFNVGLLLCIAILVNIQSTLAKGKI